MIERLYAVIDASTVLQSADKLVDARFLCKTFFKLRQALEHLDIYCDTTHVVRYHRKDFFKRA